MATKRQKKQRKEQQRLQSAVAVDDLLNGDRRLPTALYDNYQAVADTKSKSRKEEMLSDIAQFTDRQFTPGARRAAEILLQIQQKMAGGKPVVARRKAKTEKDRFVTFIAPNGQTVTVDLKNHPLLRIYKNGGIEAHQLEAANRFTKDFVASNFSGIRGPGLEPRVDTSGFSGVNLHAVDAQRRIKDLKAHLWDKSRGDEKYLILEAVCGYDINISEIHAAGGDDKRSISLLLQQALNGAARFYELIDQEPETKTVRALKEVLFHAAKMKGEHVI